MSAVNAALPGEPAESFQVLDELNRIAHSHVNLGVRGPELQQAVAEHCAQRGLRLPPTLRNFFVDFVEHQHNRRPGR